MISSKTALSAERTIATTGKYTFNTWPVFSRSKARKHWLEERGRGINDQIRKREGRRDR